ncbi:FecR domain-containing protein [Leptolyngbya sp. FACHB-261]|uniref:FecR family protein n=1 Tax=Leptolyngbya sp. FACHB-261 TaxID=2692806 RepID=UPI001684E580|nr:FecR family protein [Leptolyngbya sp. FACHB-261]MBD2099427.1 FecR domain-containing protein [Leptolyngbya sp. FACHB-261]
MAQPLQVRVNRWLEVRQAVGNVTYRRAQATQRAGVGTRLQAVGDVLETGNQSSATLAVDTGIGSIDVSERTRLQVQQLTALASGGRITRLQVTTGQARLRLRPFTNPNSRLEVLTPAGLSGVRGTVFGVSVQPSGKTGVATLEGSVVAAAQGQSVPVTAGFQSSIVPGEPPSPPVPLRNDTRLALQLLTAEAPQTAHIIGQVDPVNLLTVADVPQDVDQNGRFEVRLPLPADRRVRAVVTTPLGKQQVYELAVP